MQATLDSAKEHVQRLPASDVPSKDNLISAFFDIQQHLMHNGSAVQHLSFHKQDILWIGDKKPVQHCDPKIRSFISCLFPDARYIHLIRHPGPVLASMRYAANSWDTVPDYWKSEAGTIVQRWLANEEQVLTAKKEFGSAVHTIRYEDLLRAPVQQMQKCFRYLQLNMATDIRSKIASTIKKKNIDRKISISRELYDSKLESIMHLYGYDFDGTIRNMPDR